MHLSVLAFLGWITTPLILQQLLHKRASIAQSASIEFGRRQCGVYGTPTRLVGYFLQQAVSLYTKKEIVGAQWAQSVGRLHWPPSNANCRDCKAHVCPSTVRHWSCS
jgi:hypothetical protein